ncbi:hypothetical protein BJX63DRAFT_431841 [Aspergillus granulosus]|uniref:Uncharacterized protein n=1 Tax=Aspergillus granulosus TaxID=176169 RepID=A0ABR4HE24_9EURO
MKRRATVRLPGRFHKGHAYSPLSQRPRRKVKNGLKPRFSEYNPNLPAAAFPTLDRVRADGNEDNQTNDDRASARKSLEDIITRDELEDVPVNALENYMASNGDLNPIYVSNMVKMAAAGQDLSVTDEMEDSDEEEVMTETSKTGIQTPTWADLSRRMQAEIFSNLLEYYNRSKVNHILGLTEQEYHANEDLLCRRSQQIRFEDAELSAMRAKQLRDLLKVDNSVGSKNCPYLLLFCKASCQTFCILKQAMETNFDFLCCEGAELTTARKFLRARGIDTKFAGDWGNDIVLFQGYEDENSGPEAVAPSPNPILLSEDAEGSIVSSQPSATLTNMQGTFLNWFGGSAEGAKMAYAQPNGESNSANQLLTLRFKSLVGHEKLRGRKRKREDYDQSRYDQMPSSPASHFYREPRPTNHYVSASVSERLARLHCYRVNSTPSFFLTKNKVDYANPDPVTSVQEPSSFFLDVIGEIISARNETLTRTPEHQASLAETSTDNHDSELLGLVKTSVFVGLSPFTPSTAKLPTDSDEQLLELSNLGSSKADATIAETSSAASTSTCQTDCTDLQPRKLVTLSSRPKSFDVYDDSCLDEVDEEDEMVLLSTEPRA